MATLELTTPTTNSFQRRVDDLSSRIERVNDTVASSETPPDIAWPARRAPEEFTREIRRAISGEEAEQTRKFEMLGRMMAGIVHDLNNIFAVVGGHAELLAHQLPAGAPAKSQVDVILASVRHASALAERIQSFARPSTVSPGAVDFASVVSDLEPLIRAVAGTGMECVMMTDGSTTAVRTRRDRIEQIVLNLVANARDAQPNGGVIGVRTSAMTVRAGRPGWPAHRAPGRHAVLTVADHGPGIDGPTSDRIFEPYFTTKGRAGTGLGLANVIEIVDLLGGHIELESDPDTGTVFRIFFPCAAIGADELDDGPGAVSAPMHDGETALLVDDDDDVRSLVKSSLESIGYNVIECRSGDEATKLARVVQEPIDLLVADFVMPGLGGRKLAERMRFSRPGLPVVYISGYSKPGDDLEPGTEFVAKPFSRRRLLSAVQAVSGRVVTA